MRRNLVLTLGIAVLAAGCAQAPMNMDPMQKPTPPAELAKLECMIGNWTGTAEMLSPSPEEMKATMPEGAEPPPSTFAGEHNSQWVLDGMFLRQEGWHEMGDDKMRFVEFITWDPKLGKYRSWYFSDWGERGEGQMTWSADGKTLNVNVKGSDANGVAKRGKGTWAMTGADTAEWLWEESGPMGKMKMKGSVRRNP
ncbi:MAG: DUF1579 domain-containing protein [bacterium]|nr:DUF1579 domain-containing protein [bacterium]